LQKADFSPDIAEGTQQLVSMLGGCVNYLSGGNIIDAKTGSKIFVLECDKSLLHIQDRGSGLPFPDLGRVRQAGRLEQSHLMGG
jgi:hypothetical protein